MIARAFRVFALAGLALALAACAGGPSGRQDGAAPLRPVQSVDLTRYAGLWYEIARYPNSFERDCAGVTAEYALREDGKVSVTNTCRKGGLDGRVEVARGRAQVIEGSGGARLAVNFAPIPLPAGDGNYYILYLDEDYRHAVIGEPSGRFLWMLARNPRITPEDRERMNAAAQAQGYDLAMLEEVEQP